MIKIFNDNGMIWCVRIVLTGVGYGADFILTHREKEPLIEFYDCRHEHTVFGQFVSRYHRSTLIGIEEGQGLNLQGGVPSWKVSGACMKRIIKWLNMPNTIHM